MANDNSPFGEPKEKQPASQPPSDPPQEKPFNWPTVDPDDIPEVIRNHQNTRVAEFGLQCYAPDVLLFEQSTMNSDVESQLPWISEVALKKFDYADRAFDTINTRAGVVIGWASLLTAIFFPALDRLPVLNKAIVLVLWSIPFFCMTHQGYMAFSVASLKALPVTEDSLGELTSTSNLLARATVIRKIVKASEINEKACSDKAKFLKNAIKWFYCQLVVLSLALICLSFWPEA